MDEFAQSREDDDLFADEFEPVTVPSFTLDESPAPVPPHVEDKPTAVPTNGANPAQPHRNVRKEGQERRQRGGRGGANNGLNASRYAPKAEASPSQAPPESAPTTTPSTTTSDPAVPPPTSSNPAPAPQPATEATSTRTPAVRGDRSATGGPAHKKLTEEELTAKLEKMAILNAQKTERHRLSEADQAAFQHREKELAKERREKAVAEKRNERVMEMERAKNRERKMKAQGGREWDSEKQESDIVDGRGRGRSSEFVRGGHGGVIRGRGGGLAGSRYAAAEDEATPDAPSSRGRGTFEIRDRGRGGRGGRGGKASNAVPTAEDFPSLPSAAKVAAPELSTETATSAAEKVKSPGKPAGDWAEEMATPVEEKKMTI